jgi:hypothetical protein
VGFDGEQCASIRVRTEWQAVVLMFRVLRAEGWEDIQQRVPVTWTPCHLGGGRPWFRCNVQTNGQYCGRRVALLYGAGGPFACRSCYGLPYASQREALPISRTLEGAEGSSSVGRQREHVRRFPGKAEGHAPANLHSASPFS